MPNTRDRNLVECGRPEQGSDYVFDALEIEDV
jgi:hypothetical protein